MNFKRIQTIFIVAFVILDLFLLASYAWGSQPMVTNSHQSQQVALRRQMRADDIKLPLLSDQRQSGYYVLVTPDQNLVKQTQNLAPLKNATIQENENLVTVTYDKPVVLNSKTIAPAKVAPELTHQKRLMAGNHYLYQPDLSTSKTLVYSQELQGRPLLDSAGELRIFRNTSGAITGYTQGRLSNSKLLRSRQPTISQLEAVNWLYKNNQLANNSKVRWVKLGYTKLQRSDDQLIYVPAWVAEVKNQTSGTGHLLRVNAFRENLIKVP